jgi:hypothetical protein
MDDGTGRDLGAKLRAVGWTVTESGCWEWRGTRNVGGYGVFVAAALGIKRAMAHRIMYEHSIGPIPEGLILRHKCDNPPCVNPEHLIPGTQADNSRDMLERGRQRQPAVTADQVELAQAMAAQGATRADISAALGISERTLSRWLGRTPGRPSNGTSRWAEQRRRKREELEG